MSSILTKNFKISLAKQVQNLTDVNANSYLPIDKKSYIYVVLGQQLPWNSGVENVPTPGVTDNDYNDLYKKAIFVKQLSFENSSLVVERNDWVSNTVYNTYESTSNFYVLNSKDQVFKCLSNVSVGTASTNEPELTLSATSLEEPYVATADGYKWKYMYTISSVQKQKFTDENWMPVVNNKFVRASAIPSSIDVVNITNSGNNYTDGSTQSIISVVGDGSGAILKANVVNGQVQDVIIQNRGQDYTSATLLFTDVPGGIGSGASAIVSIAPHDGHGYDPVYELGASTVMFNVEFDGTESGVYPTDNEFRQIFVVSNPYEYETKTLASKKSYTLYTKIKTSPGLGDFSNDEVVYQGTTFNDATFTAEVISFDEIENYVYVNNITGTLNTNQALKGFTSGSIRVATSSVNPTLHPYSGKVLYISDKLPVSRDADQTDRIKFILSF
jgi:dUTPase